MFIVSRTERDSYNLLKIDYFDSGVRVSEVCAGCSLVGSMCMCLMKELS
jgi:hypothetical protein